MKHDYRFLIVLLILMLTSCKSETTPPIPTEQATVTETVIASTATPQIKEYSSLTSSEFFNLPWEDRQPFTSGLKESERESLDELPGLPIYRMEISIQEDRLGLTGHSEVLYTNLEESPLQDLYFRLYPNLFSGKAAISSLTVAGQAADMELELLDSALHIPLSTSLQPGEQIVIGMDFSVEIPPEMSGNYGLFGYIDGTLVLHHAYPVIPVYDDEGWNVEIPPVQGDVSYYDASFYLVRVDAPASLIMATSGIELDRSEEGNRQLVTFSAGPARDFYLAASDDFSVVSKKLGETVINSYYLPGLESGAQLSLLYTSNALQSYSERLGPYPYTELDLVTTPMQALGMEYAGIVALAQTLYDPDEVISGLSSQVMLESAIAHEIAHQWFFNVVGNDQVDEPWVDEAIVQYFTGMYYKDTYGSYEGFRDSWMDRWGRVDYAEIPIGMTTGFYEGSEYGAIVYGRGPLFIEALSQELGEEVFDEFIRDYYETNRWGIGTAAEVREFAERHCNCDLTALFEEWVYE